MCPVFRPGRGTLSPLQNLLTVVLQLLQRTRANKAMYAYFFNAAKPCNSVPHALLLHRLIQWGVTGPAFAILLAMYSSASSRVPAGSALSPGIGDMRSSTGLPTVPAVVCNLPWPRVVGHAYPVALRPAVGGTSCLTTTVRRPGLCGRPSWHSCNIAGPATKGTPAVHMHSLHWFWLLSVPKSVVMVVGRRSVCARMDPPELWWDVRRLQLLYKQVHQTTAVANRGHSYVLWASSRVTRRLRRSASG